MKKLLLGLLGILVVAIAVLGGVLWQAHAAIDAIDPPLPAAETLRPGPEAGDLPVRLSYLNTARQTSPRSGVLEADLDPHPGTRYVMGFPAFVLEWQDGRIFLIDAGMTETQARDFGARLELTGAEPIEAQGSVAEQLGSAVTRVAGVAFTHLHEDHTGGLPNLCDKRAERLPVFQGPLQFSDGNYTTRAGEQHLRLSRCVERRQLSGGAPLAVPGFPGLFVIPAGGHTPGSQIFVAHVRGAEGTRTWVFTGDIVNHIDGVRLDVPKPFLYSLLIVPEASERMTVLRGYLRKLAERPDVALLVSHDLLQIESSGLTGFTAGR